MSFNFGLYVLLYTVALYGFCWTLVYGDGPFNIIKKIREYFSSISDNFAKLWSCMMCMPTQVSLFLSLVAFASGIHFTPFSMIFSSYWVLGVLFDMFFGGAVCYILNTIIEYIEGLTNRFENGEMYL